MAEETYKERTNKAMRELKAAEAYILRHKDTIRQAYGSTEYLAVSREGTEFVILGHNPDEFKLSEQMTGKFPRRDMLVSNLERCLLQKMDKYQS